MLPFSKDEFFGVFATYNPAIFPAQVLAYLLGLLVVAILLRRPDRHGAVVVSFVLSLMWIWTGIAYHWLYFAAINPLAQVFAVLFVAQGLLVAASEIGGHGLNFGVRGGIRGFAGWTFIVYAAVIYPVIGFAAGHAYPAMPMFGVTPCPVTIFTLGVLILASPAPRYLFVIPVLWSLVGGSAALLLDVPQDWFLLLSGITAAALVWAGGRARNRMS
ncbi:MAG: hypothetical protein KF899_11225 [Parvibaculum sp.]|nr:hypothetical protein [Parvibaculum sp.]